MNAPRPQGIPLRPDRDAVARDWKRGFIRSATATVLGRIQKTSADAILRESWPNDRTAELIVRAPVVPMKAADFPGGSVVKLMLLAPRSAAARLFELATVVDLKGLSQFSFPLPTNFSNAVFIGEGSPIPVKQGVFAGMPVGPVHKLAVLAGLSGELETATGNLAETIIGYALEVAVGRGLDAVLLSSAAATADAPAGLLFGLTPLAAGASMSKDLSALIASIAAAGIDTSSVVFVCAPPQALAISLQAGPHFAHRIIEASGLAAGTVIAVAVSGLVIAGDGGVPNVDISKQATLHFADPASQISTVGTPSNIMSAPTSSQFQTDTLALRCTSKITWAAAPGAVSVVNSVTW
jgi:hypothetical protein